MAIKIVSIFDDWVVGIAKYSKIKNKQLVVRNSLYGENPKFRFQDGRIFDVSFERPDAIPESVKKFVYVNAKKLWSECRS